jgi:hypothetical protein
MDTLAKQHQTLLAENQALKDENILLKQKIEALEKQKALQNLEDALIFQYLELRDEIH